MKQIGEAAAGALSPQQSTALSQTPKKLSDTLKYAKILLGSHRVGEANDPEIYTKAVAAILSDYPEDVVRAVVDPRTGLQTRCKWLPLPSEVKEACESADRTRKFLVGYDLRSRKQLAERDEIERQRLLTKEDLR